MTDGDFIVCHCLNDFNCDSMFSKNVINGRFMTRLKHNDGLTECVEYVMEQAFLRKKTTY